MMAIHPVIRVVSFIVMAGFLSLGDLNPLLMAATVLVILYGMAGGVHLKPAMLMLRRMRWLFLSLVIIYFWFTPGEPPLLLSPALSVWLPTLEGMEEGAIRIVSLIALVLAVNLLLQTTSREQLLSAIHWLARPLRLLGVSHDRLAVRMALVLETVPKVQALTLKGTSTLKGSAQPPLRGARAAQPVTATPQSRTVDRIGDAAAVLYQQVLVRADDEICHAVEIPENGRPAVRQWLYPAALGVALWLAHLP
ncbi:MAG: hypothetical protein M3A44_10830 [Gammaproteobacteria bacterium]